MPVALSPFDELAVWLKEMADGDSRPAMTNAFVVIEGPVIARTQIPLYRGRIGPAGTPEDQRDSEMVSL